MEYIVSVRRPGRRVGNHRCEKRRYAESLYDRLVGEHGPDTEVMLAEYDPVTGCRKAECWSGGRGK